jgi:class 3 adenylate cyclase/predicted ATPase
MKFCIQCGCALVRSCAACGFANPLQARFCGQCATPLASSDEPPVPTRPAGPSPPQPESNTEGRSRAAPAEPMGPERRQLTVMFCDLVGSTALAAQLDPEELRDVVQAYQATCDEVIRRYDGHIAQYLGDGLVVYFGYPRAHEDDARRAGHAALEILESLATLNRGLEDQRLRLDVRIGIDTGPTVVGEIGSRDRPERLALGETPNVAARIQSNAAPNTVLISDATYRLLQSFFSCEEIGPQSVLGLSRPLHLYRLVAERGLAGREVAAARLTPLVGRQAELDLLVQRWQRATERHSQLAVLGGEAGMGKSRLVRALKERLAEHPHVVVECACSPYYQNSALYPVTDVLNRWLDFRREDSAEQRLSKLETALQSCHLNRTEAVPLLASLLSLPLGSRYPRLVLEPARQRQKTLETLVAILLELAAIRPLLLIVEDLHWVDPSTLDLLTLCIDRVATAPVLVLLTCRPDFAVPWTGLPQLAEIRLQRLGPAQSEEIASHVAGGKRLPPEVMQQLVERTDGIPLFIEETTKAILESDLLQQSDDRYQLTGTLQVPTIPVTLQDALMGRLDRLGTGKQVAQIGAAIGRRFSYELLQAVSSLDQAVLGAELRKIVNSGLLDEEGRLPHATYIFKHALIQDAAYQSLLRRTRQQYHRDIARALEERFPETADTQPELMAHHLTEAGLAEPAIPYWQKAGEVAIKRAAFLEAINHLGRGIEALQKLADGTGRDRREIGLQTALGMALQATRGYAAPEVDRAYTRARTLCERAGDENELVAVVRGQHLFYGVRADYRTGMDLVHQLLELGERNQNPGYQLEAHLAMGLCSLYMGRFLESRAHFEQGLALYKPEDRPLHSFHYLGHSAAICRSYLGRTLSFLGYQDQAVKFSEEGLVLARTFSIPMSQVQAMGMLTILYQARRDFSAAREWASNTIWHATEYGFPYWSSLSAMVQGSLVAQQGHLDQGLAQLRRALDRHLATGAKLGLSWFLVLLAELYGMATRWEEGFQALSQALAHVEDTEERYYAAEVHRLRGELLLRQSGLRAAADAETCLRQALDVARRQAAKAWELRAATSLARLWCDQNRADEARALLTDVYNWFTEGFDTPDLQDARRLLDELARAA